MERGRPARRVTVARCGRTSRPRFIAPQGLTSRQAAHAKPRTRRPRGISPAPTPPAARRKVVPPTRSRANRHTSPGDSAASPARQRPRNAGCQTCPRTRRSPANGQTWQSALRSRPSRRAWPRVRPRTPRPPRETRRRRNADCQVCPFASPRRARGQVWQPALRRAA
jgi:hypothetical protein